MIWRTWNFLGSARSRARKWRKWFVTICLTCWVNSFPPIIRMITYLSILSSGLPFFKNLRAFVKWSFKITASCLSFPIRRFFSLTSFSNGIALSSSFCNDSRDIVASLALDSVSCNCFRKFSICAWLFSTNSRSSRRRASHRLSLFQALIYDETYLLGFLAMPVGDRPR